MFSMQDVKIKIDDFVILDSVSLKIVAKSLNIIIGSNGAGKTYLLNVISGVKKPSGGEIINDFKKRILIPQNVVYPPHTTLFEYVSSVFYKSGWKWFLSNEENAAIENALEQLELLPKKDLYLNQLSGGELQLANIALSLLSGADFIMLDEPISNLDLVNLVTVLNILKNLSQQGLTIAIVLHDLNFAAKYGDVFIAISKNKKIIYVEKNQVLNEKAL